MKKNVYELICEYHFGKQVWKIPVLKKRLGTFAKNSEYCGQSIDVVLCIVCLNGYLSSKYMFYYYNPPLNGWNNAESKTLFNQSYYNLNF